MASFGRGPPPAPWRVAQAGPPIRASHGRGGPASPGAGPPLALLAALGSVRLGGGGASSSSPSAPVAAASKEQAGGHLLARRWAEEGPGGGEEHTVPRAAPRARAVTCFARETVVPRYEALYRRLLAG